MAILMFVKVAWLLLRFLFCTASLQIRHSMHSAGFSSGAYSVHFMKALVQVTPTLRLHPGPLRGKKCAGARPVLGPLIQYY